MFWTKIKRVVRWSFASFWRNGFVSLAAVAVMTITLFVIGSLVFTGALLRTSIDALKDKVDVNVYFVTSAPEDEILSLKKSLEALPEVAKVEYVSREQALADFKMRHQNDQLTLQSLDELGDNPLGAAFNIKAKDAANYFSRGMALANNLNYDKALGDFLKALSLNPNLPTANNYVGFIYIDKGKYDEAEPYLKKAIEQSTNFSKPYLTAFKPYFGHTLGNCALLETIILLLCMSKNTILPILNYEVSDELINLKILTEIISAKINTGMKMAWGFGGYNAVTLFKKY